MNLKFLKGFRKYISLLNIIIYFFSENSTGKNQWKTDLISPGYGSAFSSEPARKTWLFFIDFIQSTSNSKNDSLFTKNSIWHFVGFSFVWIIWIFQVYQKYEISFSNFWQGSSEHSKFLHNLIAFLIPSINIKCNSWENSLWFHSSNEYFYKRFEGLSFF